MGPPVTRKSTIAEDMREVLIEYGFLTTIVYDNWPADRPVPVDNSRDTVHIYVLQTEKYKESVLEICSQKSLVC